MKNFLLKTWLIVVCLLFGVGTMWAEEETIDLSKGSFDTDHITWNGTSCSITQSKISGSTAVNSSYISAPRVYKGHLLTFAAKTGFVITKIEIGVTSTNYGVLDSGSSINGTTVTSTGVTASYTSTSGGTHSLTCSNLSNVYVYNVSNSSNLQLRISSIKVTYAANNVKKDVTLFSESTYSVAPSATGNISEFVKVPDDYDGTIYYGSKDNNVFVLELNGDYLAGDGGSTTIYASANATAKYNKIYEEVTINVEKQKAEPNISFVTPSYTFTCFDEDKSTQSLSNPYGLNVTYASSNTNVATVDGDGVVTVKDYAGTTTITATFTGNEDYKAGSASFDITVNRAQTGYAFSANTVDVTIGENFDVPTISATNPNADLTLTFTSNNTNVATVTSTGKNSYSLTITGPGSTTIKAAWNQTPRFERGEATFTLAVTDPNSEPSEVSYVKVTSQDDIVDGGIYLIGCNYYYSKTDHASFLSARSSNGNNLTGVNVSAGVLPESYNGEVNNTGCPYEITIISQNDGCFALKHNNQFLKNATTYSSSYSNKLTGVDSSEEDNTHWTLTYDEETNTVVIVSAIEVNNAPVKLMCSASAATATTYNAYGKEQNPVILYKKVGGAAPKTYGQFTISDYFTDGQGYYYGTFYSDNAWEVPADVEAQTVGVTDDKLTISTLNDNNNNVVAAGTAVLLKASTPGTYVYAESDEEGASAANNLLDGSSEAVTAESMAAAHPNCTYYRMTKHNGTTLGFWWGAEDGAAFALAANKAYLAVPTQQASNLLGFRFGDYTITAIQEAVLENNGSAIYNLQGQRINRLQQGVNIVNGRKVIR